MPAKSILETRIRERLEVARGDEREASVWVENSRIDLEAAERKLGRVRSDIAMLEDLLAPDSDESFREHVTDSLKQLHTEEGSPLHPGYVPGSGAGEDGLPGKDASDE